MAKQHQEMLRLQKKNQMAEESKQREAKRSAEAAMREAQSKIETVRKQSSPSELQLKLERQRLKSQAILMEQKRQQDLLEEKTNRDAKLRAAEMLQR